MRRSFVDYCARQTARYGDEFTAPKGAEFIAAYESQERVEVTFGYGETQRGRVSLTTGWAPCFILMRRVSDSGSSYTINPDRDKITARISA